MTYYFDASLLLGLLFREGGQLPPIAGGDVTVSSRLVEVETSRALDRERLLGHLDDAETAAKNKELSDLLSAIDLAPVSDEVIALARATFPVTVRALDALHVATAQALAGTLGAIEFWTHDKRQGQAALSRGLDVRGLETSTRARAKPRRGR